MTENEAIKKLKQHFEYLKHAWKPHPDYETMDAIGYAISALETVKKLSDCNMTAEVLENYMQFEDECVKKGFTFRSVIEAREKQIPKKAEHKVIKYGKHKWRKDENGEIDDFAFDYGYHNGVVCEICGEAVCVHCNPDWEKLDDCEDDYYICHTCGDKFHSKRDCCSCGQKLDWSDEE